MVLGRVSLRNGPLIAELFALLFALLSTFVAAPAQGQEARLVTSFPDEDSDVFLGRPMQMIVADGSVHVIDYQQHNIVEFDLKGAFVRTIGSAGAGPGELNNAQSLTNHGDSLVVSDTGNGRLSVFHKDGSFGRVVHWPRSSRSLTEVDGNLLVVNRTRGFVDQSTPDDLISVFDMHGEHLDSFGEWVGKDRELSKAMSASFVDIHDERIYLLSAYYPLLRVFSLDGELLEEWDFGHRKERYEERVPENFDWSALSDQSAMIFRARFLFRGVQVTDRGVFVGMFDDDLIIDHFGFDRQFIARFHVPSQNEDGMYLHDFEVIESNGAWQLMALVNDMVPHIAVYELKW